MSESAKHRHLVEKYLQGNGVDLGSGGDPICPWAIQVDLPSDEYKAYNSTRPEAAIQWRGHADNLPFKDGVLDWVHSSHLIEDYANWNSILAEWKRVLKQGGHMIIAVPDRERFRAAVARGQGDNLSHRHEAKVGELSAYFSYGYHIAQDSFVNDDPNEYSILFIAQKIRP